MKDVLNGASFLQSRTGNLIIKNNLKWVLPKISKFDKLNLTGKINLTELKNETVVRRIGTYDDHQGLQSVESFE